MPSNHAWLTGACWGPQSTPHTHRLGWALVDWFSCPLLAPADARLLSQVERLRLHKHTGGSIPPPKDSIKHWQPE
eukprot:scaffold22138_cov16-Prasinocladus_malaysianus.AAC.1